MVYCGKPSRGCQMCRTRRIKCDETKPTCLQCLKSRRQCPGYKDDFDLVFRNETQATERRARRSITSKKIKIQTAEQTHRRNGSGGPPSAAGGHAQQAYAEASSAASLPEPIDMPVEHQAFHYFLANWVLVPRLGSSRGYMNYLLPLLKGEPSDTPLSTAFTAVALASLATRPHSRTLLPRAKQSYTKGLQYVNNALKNPSQQKTDQTLASVLLLGLFETLTLRRGGLASWGTHIEGAVMLVKMRGRKQLRTPVGRALFLAVRTQMIINCMSASRTPDLGIVWWTKGTVEDDVAGVVSKLNLLACELRADVNRAMTLMPRTSENWEKTVELVRRAQELEQQFVDWEANLPVEWHFKTIAWADGIQDSDLTYSEVYPGKVDVYSDVFIAATWNMARVARLLLSGIIIRCAAWSCAPVDYRTTPDYAQASRLGIEMINDIVASVPYHLGWRGFRSHSGDDFKMSDIAGFPCGETDLANGKTLGGYFMIWPLFTASCSDFITDAQRRFIVGRMRHMSDQMGLYGSGAVHQFQLRLPSMVIKRDLMCMFAAAGKIPASGNPNKSGLATVIPATSPSALSISSNSTLKSPTTASPLSALSSLSSSPTASRASNYSPTESSKGKERMEIKGEENAGHEEVVEKALEQQAELPVDWEKKKAEKEAFDKSYKAAIQETTGDDVEYLHPKNAASPRPQQVEGVRT